MKGTSTNSVSIVAHEVQADKESESESESTAATSTTISGKLLAMLIIAYILFIILGGIIFHFIESENEQEAVVQSSNQLALFLRKW